MAGLTGLHKTLSDLDQFVSRETSIEKRNSSKERLAGLRRDYDGLKAKFDGAKKAQRDRDRQLLLSASGPSSSNPNGPSNPYRSAVDATQMTEALLKDRERATLGVSESRLDEMLFLGQSTLESLRSQRLNLKVPIVLLIR